MKVSYIELLGEKHPLCFSLAAASEVTEAFGGLENMSKSLSLDDIGKAAKAIDAVLTILMRAGRIYVKASGGELPPELPCRPSDLIDVTDGSAIRAIFERGRHAGQVSTAWLYFNGAKAGLTRFEVENLPIGRVLDQIACWQIAECGAKEAGGGDLFEQMRRLKRR